MPTLQGMAGLGWPLCLFTDYCEEAALRAEQMATSVAPGLHTILPVQVNPFRKPMRLWQADSALPSYSNCFIFGCIGPE